MQSAKARLDIEYLQGGHLVSTADIPARLGLKAVTLENHVHSLQDDIAKVVLAAGQSSFLLALRKTICIIHLDPEMPSSTPINDNFGSGHKKGCATKTSKATVPGEMCNQLSASARQNWHSIAQPVLSGAAGGLHYVVCTEGGAFSSCQIPC
jgi:hypothetical protein